MWTYNIKEGTLTDPNGNVEGVGYSGQPQYKNDPTAVGIRDEGPIPPGSYSICTAYTDVRRGPYAMQLTPASTNEMFGRAGFMIHGDSIADPGTASDGCIIMDHDIRVKVATSSDRSLLVLRGDDEDGQEAATIAAD